MRDASKRFRDKPVTALETGKLWVEYVLQNKVSDKPSSFQLNFIELSNLDVYVIIFLIIMLILMIPGYFLKKIMIACRSRLKSQSAKSKIN